MGLHHRLAVSADIPALTAMMDAAIDEPQRGFLDESQIASSRAIMGIDSQLISDSTYFAIESEGGDLIGCGGWSLPATLYGSNSTPGRDSHLLDPAVDAARVRAMDTHPRYARRGVGRMILALCETAAAREGFTRLELMATLSGEPLYKTYGFRPLERVEDATGGVPVPLIKMEKPIDPALMGGSARTLVVARRRKQDLALSRKQMGPQLRPRRGGAVSGRSAVGSGR